MEIELLKNIIIGMPLMLLAAFIYAYLLLSIAKQFSSKIKFLISMLLYLIFAVIIVSPLFYLLSKNQSAIQESTYNLIAVVFSGLLINVPGLYYLGKVKAKELQNAGYFIPRK